MIEIVRNGSPIAVLGPPRERLLPALEFRALLEGAPDVDSSFADDVREARAALEPPRDPWAS